jgi:hypothetical protein
MRHRQRNLFAISLGLVMLMPVPVLAEQPFFFVSRAEPLDEGTARVEGDVQYDRFSSTNEIYTIETSLFFGVVNNLDFEVSVPYRFLSESARDESGVGDVTLRARLRFVKAREANPLSLSGQLVIKLPSASEGKGLGTGESDVGFVALASKRFDPLAVHLNLGYLIVGDPPGVNFKNEVIYALGFEFYTAIQGLGLYAELGGHTNRDSNAPSDPLAVSFGLTQTIGRRTILDGGLAVGLTSDSPSYAAKIGASYRF